MKKRVLVLLMSALFFAPTLLCAQTQVVEASASSLRLQMMADAPVLESVTVDGLSFTTVHVESFGQSVSRGLPALPFKTEMMEMPQGARPVLVIDHVESHTLNLAAAGFPDLVFPAQGPRSKNPALHNNKLFFDTAVYASYRAPESPVALGGEATLHGLRLQSLHITPVAYDPASHTLTVYTRIDFHIDFIGADMAATREFKAKYASVAYQGIESGLLYSLRGQMPEAKATATAYMQPPVYVIVSDPIFRDSLQKFIAWKTLLGFRVLEAYTDQTGVGETKESIRAYLKKLYDEATPENPAPTYVLFVGDVTQIPTRTYKDPYFGDMHVSDIYLCEYTGDRLPDVLYGRMSATNVDELMPQIDKLMYMENIPYEKSAFLNNSFLIAGVDDDYARSHLNPTINYLHSLYFKDSASRHCSVYLYPESNSAASKVIRNINDGVSVGVYTAHGEWNRWENPRVTNDNILKFTNKDKYPFLVGNCCLTGKMNSPSCFGETLLRKKDAGAVVYIGASNSSYFDEDVYWAVGYTENISESTVHTYANTGLGANDAFFHTHGEPYAKWALSAAEIMHAGNMAVEGSSTEDTMKTYYWQIYHVFGDPSYMPYNHRPEPVTAVYPSTLALGQPFFEVITWPYARVALSFEGRSVAFAVADAQGRAKLDMSGLSDVGDLSLCISAQNGLPLLDKVMVVLPGNKMVVVRSEKMRSASGGEHVSVWTYGQNYKASYIIRNVGREAVRDFKMRLVSEDTCVKFESEPFVYEGELAVDEEVAVSHDFAVAVSPFVKDQSRISYKMHIEFGHPDSVSESPLLRAANAPSWEILSFAVMDSTSVNGMDNGILDAGEKATGVVTVKNVGLAVARNLSASFSCAQDYVKADGAVQELGDVASGQSVTLYVDMEGAEGDYVQRPYALAVHLRTEGRTDIVEAASFMGVAVETFERGDFSYAAWRNDRQNPWEIDDSRAHEGKYSAASKKGLADNASSSLFLEVDMPFNDEISFYCFTSTERQGQSMGDLLNFYIDGTRMGRFGGKSEQWEFARYEVEAGLHTFEWRYKKDAVDSEGEDRVWIDDVRLPYKTLLDGEVFNEKGGATTQLSSLRLSVVRASAGRLQVAVCSPRGEVSGVLKVVNVLGATVAVLDPALRAGIETEEHTYEVGDLPSGLYLCTLTTPTGHTTACKFVMR